MLIEHVLSRECGTGESKEKKSFLKLFNIGDEGESTYSAKNWKNSSSKNMPKFEWTFALIEKKLIYNCIFLPK